MDAQPWRTCTIDPWNFDASDVPPRQNGQLRGIVQPFIFLMQIATLVYFSKLGILGSATLTTYFWCLPAVVAGTWLGLRLFDRIDDTKFRRVVLIFLLISGVTLVL